MTATTWNPADKLNTTLSNGNLTATIMGSSYSSGARSTTSKTTGKFAFSITSPSFSLDGVSFAIGVSQSGQGYSGNENPSMAYSLDHTYGHWEIMSNGSSVATGLEAGPNSSSVITVLLDATSGILYFQCDGVNLFDADPVAGTLGYSIGTGNWFASVSAYIDDVSVTVNFAPTGLPSGWSAWDDSGGSTIVTGVGSISDTAVVSGVGKALLPSNRFYGYLARKDAKRYFEIKINDNASASNTCVGIAQSANTDNYVVLKQDGNFIDTSNKKILAVSVAASPYILMYDFSNGSPVKMSDPSSLPSSNTFGCAWSPNGRYLAVTNNSSPYITIYDWITGTPTKLLNPTTLPTGNGYGCCWSPDSRYLVVCSLSSPYILIYDLSTGSPVKIANPATMPAGFGIGCAWSPNGRYLSIVHGTSPYVTIYDWNTGSPVKITNPATLPTGSPASCCWSPDNRYLAIAHNISPYITIYDWNTGSPVKITNPANLPTSTGYGCAWSPNGRYLAMSFSASPYMIIYDWSTGSPVKMSDPATMPSDYGYGCAWSPDNQYLSLGISTGIILYDWSTGSPVKMSDPATMPGGQVSGCSFLPSNLTGPTFTTNDVITVAIDFDNNKIYFGKNVTPNTSATGISITANTNYVPVVFTDATNVSVTLNEGD